MQINGRGKRPKWTLVALVILALIGIACDPEGPSDWENPVPEEQGEGPDPNLPIRIVSMNVEVTNVDPPIWWLSLSSEKVNVTGSGPNDWDPLSPSEYKTHYADEQWLGNFEGFTISYNTGDTIRIHLTARLAQGRANMSLADGTANRCGPKAQTFTTAGVFECIIITNR